MGPIGTQEMIIIFLVALVLFGPKKLPELGRTIGKAISEFRRASSDLKASFEREMRNLEREGDALKEPVNSIGSIPASYDDYEYPYTDSYTEGESGSASSTVSASATTGAESHGASEAAKVSDATPAAEGHPPQAVEGTVARSEATAEPHAEATPQHS
jgi:TatA/E family protein of Tat protein translocase